MDNSTNSDSTVDLPAEDSTGQPVADAARGKKNRPTPKRREQEAANRRTIFDDPKVAKKAEREKLRDQRNREYQALREGDERNMPLEHRGPERRWLRDYVDARRSMGEFLLPVAIAFVILSLFTPQFGAPAAAGLVVLVFYVLVLATAIETFILIRRMKKRFIAKFGAARIPRGWTLYVISRALNLRRFRTPRPKVARGEFPV